uniref:Uncharacterized protein n=1 Tax=Prymnesium polylepis TaxID=72548 RepID=A0A6T7Y7R2_9EUKA|mmetsp:Transcript_59614/g.163505  ORF Transcript_59614/g.163505 Transcript_59614/m.163505 type:complete len:187 (-) Transcript_59614:101-661(-)
MNSDLVKTHGDLLKTSVHKHNSLDHYELARRRSRPSTARPQTAARTFGRPAAPPSRPAVRRPQSAAARLPSVNAKSQMQAAIDGETGPPMTGVTTYPYARFQTPYLNDFRAVIANTVTHPFMATTAFNAASSPHDLLSGTAFDEGKLGREQKWKTEYSRAFIEKSYVQAVRAHSNGLRSEEMMFVG